MISSDFRKYKRYGGNFFSIIFLTQGFWAILQYRIASYVYQNLQIPLVRRLALVICLLSQKVIEMLTGISIPASVKIGHSFYIGHFGNIIINANSIIGNNCNISQGVTIGVSGRNDLRGVPVIKDNVYIGANAVVAGKIVIGSNSVIGANSLVNSDVMEGTTVLGVPAKAISTKNSIDYI